jgi:hypothetical protein
MHLRASAEVQVGWVVAARALAVLVVAGVADARVAAMMEVAAMAAGAWVVVEAAASSEEVAPGTEAV